MQLTDIQKDNVRQWAAEGASLSRIQDLLAEEFNIRMSFIDVRLLVLELNATIKEKEVKKEVQGEIQNSRTQELKNSRTQEFKNSRTQEHEDSRIQEHTEPEIQDVDGGDAEDMPQEGFEPPAPGASAVSVTLSRIAQPGFAVCGDVTFSDGTAAQWGITARGELALDGLPPDYRPSPEDVRAFQTQLRNLLSGGGN